MPPSTDFTATVDFLDRADTVELATPLPSGGESRTLIWAVTVEGIPYIRSGYGPAGKWYQRALRTSRGAFLEHQHRHEVTFEPISDPVLEQAIDRAYFAKYADRWPSPTHSMTSEPARGTTLRVGPGDADGTEADGSE